jgi:molybdate transport system substrate-binding protein
MTRIFALILAVLSLLAAPVRGQPITVSAAISLKEALTQIAQDYPGRGVTLNFGASGQLAAQITQGAPVDAFISAGSREMDSLAAAGLIDPASLHNICGNELVLIAPSGAAYILTSFSDLSDRAVRRIAIGQPRTVPAGLYAQQVLTRLKLNAAVARKLVFGENVRQVLDYAARGEVDAAIVYATDAASVGDKVRVVDKADPSLHDPIVYPAAVIRNSPNADAARRFLAYLQTPAAQRVLSAHGFLAAPPTTAPSP